MGQTNRIIILGTTLIAILSLGTFSGVFDEAFAGQPTRDRNPLPAVGPIGDFRCWNATGTISNSIFNVAIDVTDQFGVMNNIRIGDPIEFCASAEKNNQEGPFGLDQHFVGYDLTANSEIEPEVHDVFIPQFNIILEDITVIQPAELLVPTNKTIETKGPPIISTSRTDLHFKCYFIEDPPFAPLPPFVLDTQFNDDTEDFLEDFPFLFCNPALKDHSQWNPAMFGALIPEHLVCYEILRTEDGPRDLDIGIENQFTFANIDALTLNFPDKVCFEALKDFVPVGGTLLSVDKASLLLAAAQTSFWWLIPVIASGIGIGVVVLRKSKN